MRNDRNELAAKVEAVNRANDQANKIHNLLAPIFRPFIGEKIYKNDGSLMVRYENLIPAMQNTTSLTVYRTSTHGLFLAWSVKACVNIADSHTCTYHEVTVYIGNVRDGILLDIVEAGGSRRTDYTVGEVIIKRKIADNARRAYDDAKSELRPFSEG